MTGARLQISGRDVAALAGAEESLAALSAIVSRLDHPRPMYEIMGAYLVTATQRRFELGVAPSGIAWLPSKRAIKQGGKTLIESGRLMQSQTFNATDDMVEVGTNVIYAAIHQLGGTIERKARTQTVYRHYDAREDELSTLFVKKSKANFAEDVNVPAHSIRIPARPFLGLDDHDDEELVNIADDYVGGQEARP